MSAFTRRIIQRQNRMRIRHRGCKGINHPERNAPSVAAALVFSLAIATTSGMRNSACTVSADHPPLDGVDRRLSVYVDKVITHHVAHRTGHTVSPHSPQPAAIKPAA